MDSFVLIDEEREGVNHRAANALPSPARPGVSSLGSIARPQIDRSEHHTQPEIDFARRYSSHERPGLAADHSDRTG
jgi:hypothetical protein